jgi:hypothetical protein
MELADDLTFTVTCSIHPVLYASQWEYSFRRIVRHRLSRLYPRGNDAHARITEFAV